MGRPRVPFPFGAGVDRATGEYAMTPGEFRTLLNLIVREGKAQVRRGITEQVTIQMDGTSQPATDLVFVGMFRAASRGVVLAYELGGASTDIEVFLTSLTGLNPDYVDGIPEEETPLGYVPRYFVSEGYNRLFMAHDEADIDQRRVTRVLTYTAPNTFAGSNLQADLDGTGVKDVKFAGVERHLNYNVGWGFGSDADPDRPELGRLSLPGEPHLYNKEHWFSAGVRGERILRCLSARGRLLVLKETETYELNGYDRTTFGIRPLDPTYGIAGSRLAHVVAGEAFVWTREGPRVFADGPSADLGLPLDLGGPQPAELVTGGQAADGWSHYVPEERLHLFAFPNRALGKTPVYVLSTRDPGRYRWSYIEFQRCIWSAGTMYAVPGGAPTGYPDIGTLTATGSTITVPRTDVNAVGDETVEYWLSNEDLLPDTYTLVREVPVSDTDDVVLTEADGVVADATFKVALRYRRGTYYGADYQDPVTGGWTPTGISQSVDSVSTSANPDAPTSLTWNNCYNWSYGGKHYLVVGFSWVDGIAAGTTHVYASTTNDPDTATLLGSYAVTGLGNTDESTFDISDPDNPVGLGTWLITPGADPQYVWVRHEDGVGNFSDYTALTDTPIDVAGGCLL